MTTLAVDTARTYELGHIGEYPMIASDIVYEGAAVGLDGSGNARPLVAGDVFVGFCEQQVDNSAGIAGAKNVRVVRKGVVQLTVSGVAATDVGNDIYASDDGAFTLTASTNSRIGRVHRYVSSNTCMVSFEAFQPINTTEIAAGAVTLAKLASGITPSHVVKYAGSFTTVGGDANESITVTGAASTDIAIVVLHTKGGTPRTILTAQAATNAINVELSGDPSTDHVLKYMVLRAAA
jgi:hypothetical protein